ncbi:hypothetical protein ACWXVP_03145 [Mycoplasma sp. 1781]
MIIKDQRVKIPKKVQIIRKDDNKYVYYLEGTEYKKDKKYNIDKRVNIGKIDPKKWQLINTKWWVFFNFLDTKITIIEDDKKISSVVSIGQYLVITRIFKDLYIDEQLKNIFNTKSELIKALTFYYIDEESMASQLFEKWHIKFSLVCFQFLQNLTISMLLHKDITTKKYTWIYYRWLKQLRTYLEYSNGVYLSVDSMNFKIS